LRVAIYPGSFDPFTNGHLDITQRAARLFDRLIVAVYAYPAKDLLFSAEERVQMAKRSVEGISNVEVDSFSGLTVEYARDKGAGALVRGLRAISEP
jgi:pantetheine-phosphate adenylyltransferase